MVTSKYFHHWAVYTHWINWISWVFSRPKACWLQVVPGLTGLRRLNIYDGHRQSYSLLLLELTQLQQLTHLEYSGSMEFKSGGWDVSVLLWLVPRGVANSRL